MFEILLAGIIAGGFRGLLADAFQVFGQISKVLLLGFLTGNQILDLPAQLVQSFFSGGILATEDWPGAESKQD
jgi:Na+/H+ antiporter NhaC